MKKIIYGICGIGLGHTHRQLPIISHLAKNHKIALFAYFDSLHFYQNHFKNHPHVKVIQVATPYMGGTVDGLDFNQIQNDPRNQQDFFGISSKAFAEAQQFIGAPDLAISDYEPNAAQYAYMYNVPLYTLDQHSKYIVGDFPEALNGFSGKEDVQRLRMFFPKAEKRIIFSPFGFSVSPQNAENIAIVKPILKASITQGRRNKTKNSYVCYLSAHEIFSQTPDEVLSLLGQFSDIRFDVYLKKPIRHQAPNVNVYAHGDPSFEENLLRAEGLICSAGHSLPVEAAYLGVPMFAVPLPTYEQHMNAEMIVQNGLGLKANTLTPQGLADFFEFAQNFTPRPMHKTTAAEVCALMGL